MSGLTVLAPATGSSVGIQDEGTDLTLRTKVNFVGAGVTATDDAANSVTKITIPGGSGSGLNTGTQFLNVLDYGAVGDGTTDNRTAFRSALTAAKALVTSSGKPVAIYVPSGRFRLVTLSGESMLSWGSQVSLIGAGRDVTCLAVESESGATQASNFANGAFTTTSPGVQMHFRGFELDMTSVLAPSTYSASFGKGFFFTVCKYSSWKDLHVHGTKATGIGVDYLVDCHIQDNLIHDCGNFVAAASSGDSGIGIGAGKFADEYVTITGNIVYGCRNYGIFNERQPSGVSNPRGFLIANNSCRGNLVGIGDTGVQGSIIANNHISDNTSAGLYVGKSGVDTTVSSYETLVEGNVIARNGTVGVDLTDATYGGRVTVRGNRVAYNASYGINGAFSSASSRTSAATPAPGITVLDNDVHNNGDVGLYFGPASNTGYVRDLVLERNRVYNNTGVGLRVKLNTTRLRMVGNVMWDDQSTRSVTDAVTTSASPALTSATAAFTSFDVGKPVTGTGIPTGAYIADYTSATAVTLSQNATATATGVTVAIGSAATQTTGYTLTSGCTITDGVIKDNDGRGCATTSSITAASLAGNTVVESNPGVAAGPAAVTVTASPFTYTAGHAPEDVYIDGGTVSLIVKSAVTLHTSTGKTVRLGANEAVTITYSVAPTVVADRR